MSAPLQDSSLRSVPRVHRGKVRDIYALGDAHLLIVTTDRLSAFDVILPRPIPGKGAVLTAVTEFWMKRFAGIVPNHLAPEVRLAHYLKPDELAQCEGRVAVARKLGIRLWILLRDQIDYDEFCRRAASPATAR